MPSFAVCSYPEEKEEGQRHPCKTLISSAPVYFFLRDIVFGEVLACISAVALVWPCCWFGEVILPRYTRDIS